MHAILIALQTLVQLLLVVDVTALHAQKTIKVVGVGHGVAHPADIAQVVFFSLVYLDVDVDVLLIDVPHGVELNGSISESQLIILLNEFLLGFLVALRSELASLEP